jgi:hypothetical protein
MRTLKDVREALEKHLNVCESLQAEAVKKWESTKKEGLPKRSIVTSYGAFRPATGRVHVNTDSASVFVGQLTQNLFREHNITHTQSPSYSQNRNALAERFFQTCGRAADTMRLARGLSEGYWFWSYRHAAQWLDITPHEALEGQSPYERRNGHKPPTLKYLDHAFGAPAYPHNNARQSKTEPRAKQGVYIGHHEASGAHLIYNLQTKRILKSVDVTFDDRLPKQVLSGEIPLNQEPNEEATFESYESEGTDTEAEEEPTATVEISPGVTMHHHPEATRHNVIVREGGILDLGPSVNNLIAKHDGTNTYKTSVTAEVLGQLSYSSLTQALNAPNAAKFQEAADTEWKQLFDKKVIQEVWRSDVSEHQYIHRSNQNFVLKLDKFGKVRKTKSRACIDGRTLVDGIDHQGTDSPCPAITTIRLLIARAASLGRTLYDFDISGAYLFVDRGTVVYASYPHDQRKYRYNHKTGKREERILRVSKNWYGAPDGGRRFFKFYTNVLSDLGFHQSKYDECLWYRGKGKDHVAIATHIDDGLFLAEPHAATKLIEELTEKFGDIGAAPAEFFLGMNIIQSPGEPEKGIYLTHQSLIEKNHAKHKIPNKPVDTPLPTRATISKGDRLDESDTPIAYPYRAINGYTSYVAIQTRPDACFATSQLARVQSAPAEKHAQLCNRVANYLHHTRTRGLHYQHKSGDTLKAYSGASWQDIPSWCDCTECKPSTKRKGKRCREAPSESQAKRARAPDDKNDSRASSYGGIITMGNTPVWWKSSVTGNAATSTQESELQAAYATGRVLKSVRWLAGEMGYEMTAPTPLYVDNDGVLQTCLRIAVPSRSRHIERKFFNLKEWGSEMKPSQINTKENVSDITTKSLARDQHNYLIKKIMATAPDVHSK